MMRKLLSCFVFIGIAVVLCGFAGGCEEEKTSQPAQIEEVQSHVSEKPAEPVVETPAAPALEEKPAPIQAKAPTRISMLTSKGEIIIELNDEKAPVTVKNFLLYVNEKFFDGTIFHRVMPGFMIQGGGFDTSMEKKGTHLPIVNEASNGLKNVRGTIAMARTNNPNSATSQFFINVNNNISLNYSRPGTGYAVFGKVIKGMDVADAIVKVPTTTKRDKQGHGHANNPVETIVIESVKILP